MLSPSSVWRVRDAPNGTKRCKQIEAGTWAISMLLHSSYGIVKHGHTGYLQPPAGRETGITAIRRGGELRSLVRPLESIEQIMIVCEDRSKPRRVHPSARALQAWEGDDNERLILLATLHAYLTILNRTAGCLLQSGATHPPCSCHTMSCENRSLTPPDRHH
jgi:hypothetical protein